MIKLSCFFSIKLSNIAINIHYYQSQLLNNN